ncbi:uncharacterized protein FYW61_006601 [Anableps anableps]
MRKNKDGGISQAVREGTRTKLQLVFISGLESDFQSACGSRWTGLFDCVPPAVCCAVTILGNREAAGIHTLWPPHCLQTGTWSRTPQPSFRASLCDSAQLTTSTTNRDLLAMASTPSASALSAVLRCRGNIWTRNPPTKRPASAAYSLGLAGGTLRDSPADRGGSSRGSEWRILPRGERLVPAGGLSVSCRWDTGEHEAPGEEVFRKNGKLSISKLPQSSQSAAPSGQNAPLHQLLLSLSSTLHGGHSFSKIIHIITPEASDAQRTSLQLPAGVLKLSVTISSRLKVQSPSSSLTSLVSWLIVSKRLMKSVSTDTTQENTQIHKNSCRSGREETHDPPD